MPTGVRRNRHSQGKVKNEKVKFSVAIIGAGYAGLVLANVLNKNNCVEYTIFDAMLPPETVTFVVGDIYLPSGTEVMGCLGLSSYWTNVQSSSVHHDGEGVFQDGFVSRESISKALRQNIKEERIRYSSKITRIESYGDKKFTRRRLLCVSRCATGVSSSQEDIFGPFDMVVGADSLLSVCRTVNLMNVALIGDARWVQDRFWDFGVTRIRRGADIAMRDGLELGELIIDYIKSCQEFSRPVMLGKFCALQKRKKNSLTRLIGLAIGLLAFIFINKRKIVDGDVWPGIS